MAELAESIKKNIQAAYRNYLKNRKIQPRHGQKIMIAEITRSLFSIETDDEEKRSNDAGIVAVEAGTGTGKTVAYSLAVIPWAKAMKKKVVISTATVALQEQIVMKDLPEIKKNAELEFDFRLAKGRQRYLCLQKIDNHIQMLRGVTSMLPGFELDTSDDEQLLAIFDSLLDAFARGKWDGEKDSLKHKDVEKWWSEVTASHRECSNRNCPHFDNCSFFKARDKMDQADVIVANHDLVLADMAMGGGVILPSPSDTIYIFDEGHHLADKALQHFSAHLNLQQSHNALESLRGSFEKLKKEFGYQPAITEAIMEILGLIPIIETRLKELGVMIQPFTQLMQQDGNHRQYRFEFGKLPFEMTDHFAKLLPYMAKIIDKLDVVNRGLRKALADNDAGDLQQVAERWFTIIGATTARIEPIYESVRLNSQADDAQYAPNARWISEERDSRGITSLVFYTSPVQAGQVLNHYLWQSRFAAIVTSATLAPAQQWDSFLRSNGLALNTPCQFVPSPFDYPNNAYLSIPHWAEDGGKVVPHTESIVEHFSELIKKHEGGSLFLFSSRKQMSEVYERLPAAIKSGILMQNATSKQEILVKHKAKVDGNAQSIIFGLASFAEGIDLPGDYLTHVVIVKLPFATPDDPVAGTLSEWIESRGGNPFMAITVPSAAIKLVQASGRLIRTNHDKGTVTLLDNRMKTRRYGSYLISALPPFRRDF